MDRALTLPRPMRLRLTGTSAVGVRIVTNHFLLYIFQERRELHPHRIFWLLWKSI